MLREEIPSSIYWCTRKRNLAVYHKKHEISIDHFHTLATNISIFENKV